MKSFKCVFNCFYCMPSSKLQNVLRERKIDAALFINFNSSAENYDIAYFSRYTGMGALVIPRQKGPFLIVPNMEFERAKRGTIRSVFVMDKKKLFEEISEILRKENIKIKTLGICFSSFSYAAFKALRKYFKKIKIIDISEDFEKLRSIKTDQETVTLKKAFGIANHVYEKTLRSFKDFKSENDVAAYLVYESRKQGCQVSFPPIVASGKNASMPHYFASANTLNRGLCVIDFGIRFQNYCTDMTRTIAIGKLTAKEKEEYLFMKKIQERLVTQAKPGASCKSLYDSCASLLGNKAKYFTHSLGHGVGVKLHELPNLSPNSKEILQKNMTCTIEPGIYVRGKYGIRIEDTLIIGKKPLVLTKPTKDLVQV
mgnify:CR=1 FL=1